ncbi:MAG: hypothetical protein Fur0021_28020 [Candidatus Promineifilaceae bacterium]
MDLTTPRRAIRPLLNERDAADALAVYYAFHHPENRTTLVTYPPDAGVARGYVCLARTGIDLFRPLVTMRLPKLGESGGELDLDAGIDLIYRALLPESPVILHIPTTYLPLIRAIFHIEQEQTLRLFRLDRRRFQPLINIFVTQANSPDGLPRFIIRNPPGDPQGEIAASASLNWQSPNFADIAVRTHPNYRRQGYGRSVVASLVEQLLRQGRTPLYSVDAQNAASIELAQSVGFVDTLARTVILEGHLKPHPHASQ